MRPQPAAPVPPLAGCRLGLSLLLVALLFGWGTESDRLLAALARAWQVLLSAVGLGGLATQMQQGTSALVTTRSLPAVATYGLLYVAGCVWLLHLVLRNPQRTWWVVRVYLGLFGLCGLLLAIGKGGNSGWAYRLGRRVIEFIVSPLPAMLLLPLLWPGWGPVARPATPGQASEPGKVPEDNEEV